MSGNIKLNKNAPRDNAGRLQGEFSQHNHNAKRLAREAGGTVGYLLYSFMLDSAGGEFNFTIGNFIAMFSDMNFSESRVSRALKALINAGLITQEKLPKNKGNRPQYRYQVNEVNTKIQQADSNTTPILDDDFSASGIEAAIMADNTQEPKEEIQPAEPPKAVKQESIKSTSNAEKRKQKIFQICQDQGAFSQVAKSKVLECCCRYYRENKTAADDSLIKKFANIISENSTLDVATIYQRAMSF